MFSIKFYAPHYLLYCALRISLNLRQCNGIPDENFVVDFTKGICIHSGKYEIQCGAHVAIAFCFDKKQQPKLCDVSDNVIRS